MNVHFIQTLGRNSVGTIITAIFMIFALFLGIQAATHKWREAEKLEGKTAQFLLSHGHVLEGNRFKFEINNCPMEVRLTASANLFSLNTIEIRAPIKNISNNLCKELEKSILNPKITMQHKNVLFISYDYLLFAPPNQKILAIEMELARIQTDFNREIENYA